MGNTRENRYTVHQRLAASEARLTALEAENKALRTSLVAEIKNYVNDQVNVIQSSVRNGVDGLPGRDGRDGVDGQSIVGPQGPRGDVLIPNESEAQAALKKERLYLAQRHAALIAPIVRRLEFERTKNLVTCTDKGTLSHFWRLLQEIQQELERFQ